MSNLFAKFKTKVAKFKKQIIVSTLIVAAIAIIGAVFLLWPKSQADRIADAIETYHEGKGQEAEIEGMSYRVVSAAWPDSMKREIMSKRFDHFMEFSKISLESIKKLSPTRLSIKLRNSDAKFFGGHINRDLERSVDSLHQAFWDEEQVYRDSMDAIMLEIQALDSIIAVKGGAPYTLTKCDYIALIRTASERYTDTLTVVLDQNLRVIWPD